MPNMARPSTVATPTLLIVGGGDDLVLDLHRRAQAQLRCETRLAVVPGATHLFEAARSPPNWPATGSPATSTPAHPR